MRLRRLRTQLSFSHAALFGPSLVVVGRAMCAFGVHGWTRWTLAEAEMRVMEDADGRVSRAVLVYGGQCE